MAGQWHWLHLLQSRHVVSRCCHAVRDMTPLWPEQVSWHRHVMSSSHVVMSYKYLKKYDPYLICCLEKSHAETVKYQKQIKQVKILNIHSSRSWLKVFCVTKKTLQDSIWPFMTWINMTKIKWSRSILWPWPIPTPLCVTECKLLALDSVLCIGFYK